MNYVKGINSMLAQGNNMMNQTLDIHIQNHLYLFHVNLPQMKYVLSKVKFNLT